MCQRQTVPTGSIRDVCHANLGPGFIPSKGAIYRVAVIAAYRVQVHRAQTRIRKLVTRTVNFKRRCRIAIIQRSRICRQRDQIIAGYGTRLARLKVTSVAADSRADPVRFAHAPPLPTVPDRAAGNHVSPSGSASISVR